MSEIRSLLTLLLLLLIAGLVRPAAAAETRHVLILNSYHQGMEWTDGELAGLQAALGKAGEIEAVETHVEYMDAKRLLDDTHLDNLRTLLAYKYRNLPLAAIATTDNDAYDFMRRYRDKLFPGVPVVFAGVNGFTDEQLDGLTGFTGVAETAELSATLELMLRLHPGTRRIVVIIDATTTGVALREELETASAALPAGVRLDYWATQAPAELADEVARLSSGSLVLLMPYAVDRNARYVDHVGVASSITQRSPVPVYASWDFYLGHGIVGGKLTTALAQGKAAGEMLRRVLAGEDANRLPVECDLPASYAFDYRQLARFSIAEDALPADSRIVFRPWRDENRALLWGSVAVTLVLLALLVALFINIQRKRRVDAALREKMAILTAHDSALRELSQGVLIADADRTLTFVNGAVEHMTGYDKSDLLGQSCRLLQGPDTSEETKAAIRTALDAAEPFHGEILNYRKDGTPFWNALTITPVFDRDGILRRFVGIQNDITERKRADVELRIAAKAFEAQVAMLVADPAGFILRVNHAFTQTTGYSADEAIGCKTSILKSGRHDAAFYEGFWRALQTEYAWRGVIWNRRKNGNVYAEWLAINAVRAPDGSITHYVCSFSDITQNHEAEAEVHRLAYYDQLTGLPNRRLLQDRLGQAVTQAARNRRFGAVLILDLDNFSTFNDSRGHAVGDHLLVQAAERLRGALRQSDTVARLGGDEFAVILEDISKSSEEAAAKAQHTGHHLGETLATVYEAGLDYIGTASIGACLFDGSQSADELLQNADIAMYQAKAGGRNTLRFFDPVMQARIDRRSKLESDLRQALAREELQLYYQPQVDRAGHVFGAEILLRWRHPDIGFVSPADFIPLAEETGLILPIGQWVLDSACRQLRAWSLDPLTNTLRLSVNVSSLQFRQSDFVSGLSRSITDSAIDPTRLKLELTETLFLADIDNTVATMHAMRECGVSFALDDFGTGYSSLAYLTRLPLDELKIDQSFVARLPGNPQDEGIARTIINMANDLGLGVIAEGVETETQRAFLDRHGCPAYQGYLFSRPVPISEFTAYCRKQNGG